MRRVLLRHRWVTLLVVGLMLFATSGTTLSRMTCLAGGHSVLSFGQAGDCCPDADSGGNATLKATCCELSQAKPGTVTFVPHDVVGLTLVLMVVDAAPVMIAVERSSVTHMWLASRPPPLNGAERLASIGSLLL
ncbi:MAG: hypothetical protein ABI432_10335 [Flavobacteriales bacterium]